VHIIIGVPALIGGRLNILAAVAGVVAIAPATGD
jgi:hypothetical protein